MRYTILIAVCLSKGRYSATKIAVVIKEQPTAFFIMHSIMLHNLLCEILPGKKKNAEKAVVSE